MKRLLVIANRALFVLVSFVPVAVCNSVLGGWGLRRTIRGARDFILYRD